MVSFELTDLLHRAQQGDAAAAEAFFEESYPLLRQLARARLRGHVRTPTLDTGSLVQEAYLRFAASGRLQLADPLHFRRWAAKVMRSVIVDLARRRRAERRGGGMARLTLATDLLIPASGDEDLIVRV
ncbi:MAG: ECF-type sigma factor, partial [Acidobacteriota bacterium]|nr:ECF-type sigma factor [Acidobacteriota bacterium]